MKQLILLGLYMISISSFADTSSLSQGSMQLNTLGSAWKTHPSRQAKHHAHDLTIVYGGADVSRRPTLVSRTTTA